MRCATGHKYDPMLSHVNFFSPARSCFLYHINCKTWLAECKYPAPYKVGIQSIKSPPTPFFVVRRMRNFKLSSCGLDKNSRGGSTKFERCFSLTLQLPSSATEQYTTPVEILHSNYQQLVSSKKVWWSQLQSI